jgi:DNA-binding LytR/AlgR family response regulator
MNSNELIHLGSRKKISPSSILMLKADINYTIIYLDDGNQILSSTNLGILEKRLKEYNFFRPNKSFVINLAFMSDYENKVSSSDYVKILLKNNLKISLSRRKTAQFMKIVSPTLLIE